MVWIFCGYIMVDIAAGYVVKATWLQRVQECLTLTFLHPAAVLLLVLRVACYPSCTVYNKCLFPLCLPSQAF